jgi:hypothetical protein
MVLFALPAFLPLILGGEKIKVRLKLTTGVILVNAKPISGVKIQRVSDENISLGDVSAIARTISRVYWDTAKAFMSPLELIDWDIRREVVRKLMDTKVQGEINLSAETPDKLKEQLVEQFRAYIKKIDQTWTPIIRDYLLKAKNEGKLYREPVARNLGPGEDYPVIQPYTGIMEAEELPPFNPYGGMFDPSRVENGLYELEMWIFEDPYCQIGKRVIPNRKMLLELPEEVPRPLYVIPPETGNKVYLAYKKIIQSPIYQRTINYYLEYFPEDLDWAKTAFEYPFGEEAALNIYYPTYDELPAQARAILEQTYGVEGARELYESKISWVNIHPVGIDVWKVRDKIPVNEIPTYSRYCVSNSVALAKIRMYRLGYWNTDNFTPFLANDFEDAIKRFQSGKGLKITGEIDGDTWVMLGFAKSEVQIPVVIDSFPSVTIPSVTTSPDLTPVVSQADLLIPSIKMGTVSKGLIIGLIGFLLPFLIKK